MKRRKNAVYTGQSKRARTGTGNRVLVDYFYEIMNDFLHPEDEIEIISPEQVNPTHDLQEQIYTAADYCVRKILPEITSLFSWGDEVTPRLRALAPIVDKETVDAAADAAAIAVDVASTAVAAVTNGVHYVAYPTAADATADARDAAREARRAAAITADAFDAAYAAKVARDVVFSVVYPVTKCVYYALVACIEAGDDAAYNRIIDLTNEMLESL